MVASHDQPYNDGWSTSCVRLAAKMIEAINAMTAMAPPGMTDRTGTTVAVSPGSSAKRRPAIALCAAPAEVAAETTRDRRWDEARRRATRCGRSTQAAMTTVTASGPAVA